MIGQDLTGFVDSKIQKILLLYEEKQHGIRYSIAGASSGKKNKATCKSNASTAVQRLCTSKPLPF